MTRVGIAFSTKDRCELTRRSLQPLFQPDKFDLHWIDGSKTEEGRDLHLHIRPQPASLRVIGNVTGGADAAIVYGLTHLLAQRCHTDAPGGKWFYDYTHVGLVENDVLLHSDWFGPTMALFERGAADGLRVGAVSARAYQDRILIQRDGYAVMHNLGAGTVIFSREAAELVLRYFRTGHTVANRLLFSQLSHLDIGRWWAFRGAEQMLTADWHFDAVLAAHGYASLALTPSPVEMIGQVPPLDAQGLRMADGKFDLLRNDTAFEMYRDRLAEIGKGAFKPPFPLVHRDQGGFMYFPHQLDVLNAKQYGLWNLQWSQGFGPFAWRAGQGADDLHAPMHNPSVDIPVAGPCTVVVSGGEHGGKVLVEDEQSGYRADPDLGPEHKVGAMQISVPATVAYRNVRVTARTPGVVFYGVRTVHEQPVHACGAFDWYKLPPA